MHHNEAHEYDGDEDSDAGEGDYANNHFQHEEILRRNTVSDKQKCDAESFDVHFRKKTGRSKKRSAS